MTEQEAVKKNRKKYDFKAISENGGAFFPCDSEKFNALRSSIVTSGNVRGYSVRTERADGGIKVYATPKKSWEHKEEKYPIKKMKTGESMFFEVPEGGSIRALQRSIFFAASRLGYKITTRSEEKGLRIWMMGKQWIH